MAGEQYWGITITMTRDNQIIYKINIQDIYNLSAINSTDDNE